MPLFPRNTSPESEALKDFAKSMLQNAAKMLSQWIGIYLTYLVFGLGHKAAAQAANATVFGPYLKAATGGYITGPGTGTSDSIPAMLSNGEYVMSAAAVNRIGTPLLDAMNHGASVRYAGGGLVSTNRSDSERGSVGGQDVRPMVTLQVSAVDAVSFADFLDRGGLDRIKQALYEDNRRFASSAGVW